jgi:hypothetical protein
MQSEIGDLGENLVFLLGPPRSGTTLLSVMLDNHPAIASPPEPWLMLALAELGRVSPRHSANAAVLGTAMRRFAGEGGHVIAARAAALALYRAHLGRCGKRAFVDKTPRYALIPEFLITVFPRARFLCLRRNPLDIAASYRTTWCFDVPAILARGDDAPELFDMMIEPDRLMAFQERHADSVHVISYERLTSAPAEELEAALRHIGFKASPVELSSMLVFGKQKSSADDFGDTKIRSTILPHTGSIGNWRTAFTKAELQILLDAFGTRQLTSQGYGDVVAELEKAGVRQSDPDAPKRYHAIAEARWLAREEDITRSTNFDGRSDLSPRIQARLHAALGGDAAWTSLAAEAPGSLLAQLAESEATIKQLRMELSKRHVRLALWLGNLFSRGGAF